MKRIFIVFIALLHITAICRGDVCPAGYQPTEYQVLEYIESTGTQYIDTGFKPNQDTRVVIDYSADSTQQPRVLMNAENLNDDLPYGFGVVLGRGSNIAVYYGRREHDNYWSVNDFSGVGRYKINIYKTNASITAPNGVTITHTYPSYTFQLTNNLYLFTLINNGTIVENDASVTIYSCKIYDNGTLVRDFVPARRLADNVLGMLDKVNNVFYTNAGSGTFIAGPETYEAFYGISGDCTVCPPNTYKDTAGNVPCTPCPSTTFSKSGSTSINDCGHVMHVGDKIYFLNSQKLTSPALHVKMPDGTIYYGSLYQLQTE